MHIDMGAGKDPVGVLMQLEKPIFDGTVGQCLRRRDDDGRHGAAVGAMAGDCIAGPRAGGHPVEDEGAGGEGECEARNKGVEGVEEEDGEAEGPCLAFGAPGEPSLIAKDSNKLTIQWGETRCLEEGPVPGLTVRYAVEAQQVEVPSGRATPNGDAAAALVKADLWRPAEETGDSWAQLRGLRPGRYYAIRVVAKPTCDDPTVRLEAPECSAVAVFHTTPTVPGAPQPPQLTSRERTSLKFKWNVPESGGLDIIEFRLQLRPPPATATNDEDDEGFTEIFCGSPQTFRATKLLPGMKYTARVKARNELGEGPWSLNSVFTTEASVPATPEPPRSTDVTSTSVSLEWDVPKDNGARIDSYMVDALDMEDGCSRPVYSGYSPQCTILNLKSGATYKFKVRAENQAGKSNWSSTTTVRVAPSVPGPPQSLTCRSSTKTSASFTWSAPEDTGGSEVGCYEAEVMSTSKAAGRSGWTNVYSGLEPSCSVGGLRPGCTYQLRVRASNVAGWGSVSQPAKFTMEPGMPEKMPPPSVLSLGPTSLRLSWKPPAHDGGSSITGYQLQCCDARRAAEEGPAAFAGAYSTSLCVWEGDGLLPGTEYSFRVRALNACGASGWSPAVRGTTKAGVPQAPCPPAVCEATSDSLTIRWDPPDGRGSTVSSYTAQVAEQESRRNGFVSLQEGSQTCVPSVPEEDLGVPTACCSDCICDGLDFRDVYSGSQAQCRVRGLKASTVYAVRLRASNKAGSSEWSKAIACKTQAAAPSPPRNLQVAGVSVDSVSLCWQAPEWSNGSKLNMYVLERLSQRSKKTTWVQEYQGHAMGMSHTVCRLKSGCKYQFRVRAGNSCGVGPASDTVTVRTTAAPPGPPEGPTFSQKAATSLRVKWAPPERENGAPVTNYRLEIAQQGGAFREVYSGYTTTQKVSDLCPGQQYVFRVQATNEAGPGPWSPASSVTTALAPPSTPTNVSVISSMDHDAPGGIQGDATALEVTWEHEQRGGVAAECFEVEASPSKDRGGQLRTSVVRQVVRERRCRLGGLPAETSFVVRVRAVGAKSSGHSKWAEALSRTAPGGKRLPATRPSESGSSGTLTVPSSSRSSKSSPSEVSEDSLTASGRGARGLSVKKTHVRIRPRPRKSLWKRAKAHFLTVAMAAVAALFLLLLLLHGSLG
ncbi:unnamed protein product [Ostreobium quekettii]|uniref:Fibronectin type-III domain-containing protein n=1 Tax=Ostreobium quekettii TaxID=121088 RepID=A0A8S1IXV9_9CHLO|nr:unnamed protein product [Ostreobium quekettii]